MRMRVNSLALRLIAASALWSLVVLPIAGYVLNSIYRHRVEEDFDTRLAQLMTLLIAASALDEGDRPVAPLGFGDPLFDLPIANGWYWQIEPAPPTAPEPQAGGREGASGRATSEGAVVDRSQSESEGTVANRSASEGAEAGRATPGGTRSGRAAPEPALSRPAGNGRAWVLMSNSLVGEPLAFDHPPPTASGDGRIQLFNATRGDERLRVVRRLVRTERDDKTERYLFTLTGNRAEIDAKVADFAGKIALSLLVLGLGLVALTLLQVRFGLRPLARIEQGLARIRSGEAERLEGELPVEIMPLQKELNALIKSNQAIIERARTQVGNLAHALKTPLSVILNEAEADKGALGEKVRAQAEVMRNQINHYLDRARMAARSGLVGGVCEVAPVARALARTLMRIYEARGITIAVDCPEGMRFQGERQDLEEMLGNLLDNACKWARARVSIEVSRSGPPLGKRGQHSEASLVILVDDDGKGLDESEREMALKRGRRLDETTPGSGLGLSIVRDLAELYHGELALEKAPMGGLRARLRLPAA